MKLFNQTLIILLGFIASSSTASSFGTSSSSKTLFRNTIRSPSHHQAGAGRAFLNIRGGSNEEVVASTSFSTELSAQSSENTEPESTIPEPVPEPVAAVVTSKALNGMGPKAAQPGHLRKLFPSFPWYTLPNLLTYVRCIAIPGLILQFYLSTHVNKNIHSALIFAIASFTDYLDGFLARRWDICSPFGAFLDPVADKLMVSTGLILLAGKYGAVVAVPCSIILAREIAVSALREWMASRGQRDSVKVGFQGKCKTALTMTALSVILAVPDGWSVASAVKQAVGWDLVMNIGMIMLYMSAVVTVTSGSVYFKAAAPVLMDSK
jgi:CDP-diacylglycerol--glycerol-3-phosphate 3-phosphatidyltransferase